MCKIKIRLITLGHLPVEFDKSVIQNHESEVFQLTGNIESYALNCDSDGPDWEFSDELLSNEIPKLFAGDLLIAVSNIPLEDDYYTRRLTGNRIIFTFHEIRDYFQFENIPLENMIFRLLYGYSLVYKRCGGKISPIHELINFTHDETRGCLFDMNGLKSDIVQSCVNPIICDDCKGRLKKEQVSNDMIEKVEKEIKDIKKKLFYRLADFIKTNPIWAIIISSITAIILGAIGSIIGSLIYGYMA